MQIYHQVHVQLEQQRDRRQPRLGCWGKGKESARVLRRASILLQLDRESEGDAGGGIMCGVAAKNGTEPLPGVMKRKRCWNQH